MREARIQYIRIGAKPQCSSFFIIAPSAATVLVPSPAPQGSQKASLPTNAMSVASNLSKKYIRYKQ